MSAKRHLRIGGRLDRYVTGLFVSSYATALLLVVGLFWIMDMATNLDKFLEPWTDGSRVPTSVLVRYYVLNLPYLFLQVAPFVTLVAGMFTVNRLLRDREMIATMGAGISAHRLLTPVFVGGILAAIGMFSVREWVAQTVSFKRDALLAQLENHGEEQTIGPLWLTDLSGSSVRLGHYHPGGGLRGERDAHVSDFEAFLRDAEGVTVIRAPKARWTGALWALEEGTRTRMLEDEKVVEDMQVLSGFNFRPNLALTYHRARVNPLELSFSEVGQLQRRDPDNVVYQTLWQYQLTFPLANIVLLLVGLPVMLGYERSRGSEKMALGGLLAVFYFASDFVLRTMGLEGSLTPVLASWLPVLFFGSLGVVLYDSMRT